MATNLQDNLPNGWECKMDPKTGKQYFLNHHHKTTTWDDPRNQTKSISSYRHYEHIPLQGSPELRRNHIYPRQTSPIPAFQIFPNQKLNSFQEFRSSSRSSPITLRATKCQDTTLNTVTESDEAITKIGAMFPTVSDTHIRLLMKKYHNREALVISALQVEKNPITTPGPFATPPPQRNIHHPSVYALHNTPPLGLYSSSRGDAQILRPASGTNSTGSPHTFRASPRLHSPKLKLRYMKSIFPKAEETVILDILYNNDNNIQKSSEILTEMGFQKKDVLKEIIQTQKSDTKAEMKKDDLLHITKNERKVSPYKNKSPEEKNDLASLMKAKYPDVAEHLITIALESVNFDEHRANQIIEIIIQEDNDKKSLDDILETEVATNANQPNVTKDVEIPISQSRQSIKSLLLAEKLDKEKSTLKRQVINDNKGDFKEGISKGPNVYLRQGPDMKHLLDDYVKWQGPNPQLRKGPQYVAIGSNRDFLTSRNYQVRGSNPELQKGAKLGLAKGSIYSQYKSIISEESRGK